MRRRQALAKNPGVFAVNTVKPPQSAAQPAEDYENMRDELLGICYLAKFGKRPHHRMKRSTIVRNLSNDDAR